MVAEYVLGTIRLLILMQTEQPLVDRLATALSMFLNEIINKKVQSSTGGDEEGGEEEADEDE
jgi:hypothetical protein